MTFDLKPKHGIKGALPQIKEKKDKLTCETNPSEKSSIKKNISPTEKSSHSMRFSVPQPLPH